MKSRSLNTTGDPSRSFSTPVSFVVSVVTHVAVFGLLVTLSHRSHPVGTVIGPDGQPIPAEAAPADPAAGGGAPIDVVPFSGISYSAYSKKTGKDVVTQGRAAKLMNALNTLNLGTGRKARGAGLKSGLDGASKGLLQTATTGRADTMTKSLADRRFSFQAQPKTVDNGARRMTDKERAELKRKFQALETEFRKVYSAALNQDPQLEVTVSFEAEIKPTGYLHMSSFKAQGKYQPESLTVLKEKMSELVAKVFVAKDLAGTLIRGESVFVR